MKSVLSLGLLATVVCLTGCATPSKPGAADADQEEKIYVTGSNLPQRDRKGVKTVDPERVKSDVQRTVSGPSTSGGPR